MIAIGCDHGGFNLKNAIMKKLEEMGLEYKDFGTYSTDSCDYPDIANKLAVYIKKNPSTLGILICGTGVGMSIAINRYPFIRGALLYSTDEAVLAREHNDANVIIFGARMFENKENLGSGMSRKIGIENSKGEYTIFVDGDDYITPTLIDRMYKYG